MPLPVPSAARKGYWFAALLTDATLKGTAEATYRMDTGGTPTMGKCHNESKFGFVAFPDSMSAGKFIFRVNENNTIFREAILSTRVGTAVPPGLNAIPGTYLDWPDDALLQQTYGVKD